MTALCLILFTLSAGMLYFILRYRVHVHVTYQKPSRGLLFLSPSRARKISRDDTISRSGPALLGRRVLGTCSPGLRRKDGRVSVSAPASDAAPTSSRAPQAHPKAPTDPHTAQLLTDTLVSLGASKQKARTAANRAILGSHGALAFEDLLRAAITESTAA